VTLSGILILVCGVSAVHLSTLSWLSAYTWGYKKSGLIAPKRILLSRPHLLGVAAATTGVLVFATTALTNSLQYGIVPAIGLFVADNILIYRAVRGRSR
jgi:hypothetical protein